MFNAVIIEDDPYISIQLNQLISEILPGINVSEIITSVQQGIAYFSVQRNTDIIFSDVHLSDGISFSIFKETNCKTPVIFITGYSQFLVEAFEFNAINYLLKPVTKKELLGALEKFMIQKKNNGIPDINYNHLLHMAGAGKKNVIVGKTGMENVLLNTENIVMFYTENHLAYVFDYNNRKYHIEKNLNEVEAILNGQLFFRANRQYIINRKFIKSFRSYEKVKILLNINWENEKHKSIVISQQNASQFRKWVDEL
jgi:DNA-binding LytR/AlgR family response regulator